MLRNEVNCKEGFARGRLPGLRSIIDRGDAKGTRAISAGVRARGVEQFRAPPSVRPSSPVRALSGIGDRSCQTDHPRSLRTPLNMIFISNHRNEFRNGPLRSSKAG